MFLFLPEQWLRKDLRGWKFVQLTIKDKLTAVLGCSMITDFLQVQLVYQGEWVIPI